MWAIGSKTLNSKVLPFESHSPLRLEEQVHLRMMEEELFKIKDETRATSHGYLMWNYTAPSVPLIDLAVKYAATLITSVCRF